jgi:predicted Zn-dependent protease
MRRQWPCLLCGLSLLLGCGPNAAPQAGGRQAAPGQFKGRLDAAMAMTDLNKRDDALKVIAQDAASAGDPEFVQQALQKFMNLNLKDEAAAAAALKLAANGQNEAAVEVAKTMVDLNKRDQVLQKVAKGTP